LLTFREAGITLFQGQREYIVIQLLLQIRACLVDIHTQKENPKSATVPVTSNLAAHAWSIKYRRKKKLITQFSCKSRDKSFKPN
jgi:hypothetical protein